MSLEHAMWAAEAEKHIAAAREPRAAGPGSEPEALRAAYLDLLKLALCDVVGTATTSVEALGDGRLVARELHGAELRQRSAGMDWPLHGLTMVGLERLDDLQACVESIVADGVDGDVIEAGSWRGGASLLMRATLDCLGDARTVWVADSFQGFPAGDEADSEAARLSDVDFLAVAVDEVRATFARLGLDRGVELVPGFFEETLPGLAARRWALVRLDADTYAPTRLALETLYPGLAAGGYLVVDDYGAFQGCRRAVDEFREVNGITAPIERIDFAGARWRREDDAPERPAAVPAAPPRPPVARERRDEAPVVTARELELEREVAALRERLAATGVRAWLQRRRG
jgi:O-methyltransferase